MNNDTPNFFDRRTLTAIALVFVTWLGWQYYMQKKYPQMFEKKTVATETPKPAAESPRPSPAPMVAPSAPGAPAEAAMAAPETLFDYKSENLTFQISSKGLGIRNVKLLPYANRKGDTVEFSQAVHGMPLSFETRLAGASDSINFVVHKASENSWVGTAKVGGITITKTMEIDPAKYAFDVKVAVEGDDKAFTGLTTFLSDEIAADEHGGFLNRGYYDRQEAFIDTAESHRNHIYFSNDPVDKSYTNGHVIALGSPYFTQAFVDHSPVMPDVKIHADPASHTAVVQIQHSAVNRNGAFNVHFTAFTGPKSLELLKSVDEDLVSVIDFGFFSFIARYILALLKGFYALVGNWGVAIILLTILVRLLVLPFNIMSYRSMKAMQVLQPQMKAIREKYKDDQQRQNQEVMSLLRTHKVNPLGGCLPVVLQLPIFWALYSVLGHSIELYQAPFGLWIHDLSLKDPYYVLPVLMGATMFMQQRITPNTLDPSQAKIMMFMPLLFSFFMVSLPSGLTLYIWISALFAVVQQSLFMKGRLPVAGTSPSV